MKKIASLMLALTLLLLSSCGNVTTTVSGYVKDAASGLPIAKALVSDGSYGDGNSGITDSDGYYSYSTYSEEHTIVVTAEGYQQAKRTLITSILPTSQSLTMNIAIEKE
jgi:hypothetical protein